MFRAPVGVVVFLFVLAPPCANSTANEVIPSGTKKLIFEPVVFNCPGKLESPVIESVDAILEDVNLVFSGVQGVSVSSTEFTGSNWKSAQDIERMKAISGADVALTIHLRCSGSNTINFDVAARVLPEYRLVGRAEGSAGGLRDLRDSLVSLPRGRGWARLSGTSARRVVKAPLSTLMRLNVL